MGLTPTTAFKDIHYNELFQAICDKILELFTLCGKYSDDEKVKIFAKELANDLPGKYPYMTVTDLQVVFKNAIMGDFGELKSIDLPSIHKWVRKWNDGLPNAQRSAFNNLAGFHTSEPNYVDWSNEVWKAYGHFMNNGLKVTDISHFLYDRMQLDGLIEMEEYRKVIDKAAAYLMEAPDIMNGAQREIAKRMIVINVFHVKKKQGYTELYRNHDR